MAPPSMAPPPNDTFSPVTDAVYGDDESKRETGEAFGISGALPESTQSRARALAKQRELQMKRRQSSMTSGAMMRGAGNNSGQFTPGVAQFSAKSRATGRLKRAWEEHRRFDQKRAFRGSEWD